jgi:hypothetical protein
MHRPFACLLLSLIAVTPLFQNVAIAQSSDASISPETLTGLWSDLLESEPTSTSAILELSKYPESVTEFLATKMSPLRLTEEELRKTIAELGSDDDKTWRAAYHKLNYLDPRLGSVSKLLFP